MSFLNPVSEPVLRFKSTDAGAPQINYNARTAGDIKAVLKACLVTGYGATASAGWAAVNEVGNVIEFVSPSVEMINYRLGVDDTSAANTTWYYQYQNVRTNPVQNQPPKNIGNADKISPDNGWELLVTLRGLYFVEILKHGQAGKKVGRVTWLGQIKSALANDNSFNMSFFSVGFGSQLLYPSYLFSNNTTYKSYFLGAYDALIFGSANLAVLGKDTVSRGVTTIDIASELYLLSVDSVIAKQPGVLAQVAGTNERALGVDSVVVGGKNYISVSVIRNNALTEIQATESAKTLLICTDNWDY